MCDSTNMDIPCDEHHEPNSHDSANLPYTLSKSGRKENGCHGQHLPLETTTFGNSSTSSAESISEDMEHFDYDADDLTNLIQIADSNMKNLSKFWVILGRIVSYPAVGIALIFITIATSVAVGVIAVFVVEPQPYFDRSLDSFQIPNHISTMRNDLFQRALVDRLENVSTRVERDIGNTLSTLTRLQGRDTSSWKQASSFRKKVDYDIRKESQGNWRAKRSPDSPQLRSARWNMQLVYLAKPHGANIFTADRLKEIHDIEMRIMEHPSFREFCERTRNSVKDSSLKPVHYCVPINSLMTYFFPSLVDSEILFNGLGSELADINGTLHKAMSSETFYWYVDPDMDIEKKTSKFIRSEVWFGRPIGEDPTVILSTEEQYERYHDFIVSYKEILKNASTDTVDVLYGGNEIFDSEISATIRHDLLLAIPTLAAIATLLFVLTSFSVWLTLCGIISILASFSWAYFSYHVICGIEALGLLNLASAFVVIGIGVDDVFVFVNTFRQAVQFTDLKLRMAHTIKVAGVATFFTSFTTAGAFGANMASQIPAVYQFGLFMTFIISFCWILVLLIMPAALALWHKYLHCEQILFRKISRKSSDIIQTPSDFQQTAVAGAINQGFDGPMVLSAVSSPSSPPTGGPLDDDVIRLPDVVDEELGTRDLPEGRDNMDDTVLRQHFDNTTVDDVKKIPDEKQETASLTRFIGAFLRKFVAEPVVKGRWVIIACYVIIVVITAGLVSQIQPATRPPALFQEDTNLQRLLDLAYNFSAEDISCKSCSGYYQPPQVVTNPVVQATVPPLPAPKHKPMTPKHQATTKSILHIPETSVTTRRPPTGNGHQKVPTILTEKPSCATTYCRYNAVCREEPEVGPICSCDFSCSERLDPVCDNLGVTHVNECSLKHESCLSEVNLRVVYRRACDKPREPSLPKSTKMPLGTLSPPRSSQLDKNSPQEGYDPCEKHSCRPPAAKPILRNTATVYVVFGLSRLDRGTVSHHTILSDSKGTVYYNKDFDVMRTDTLRALCKICHHLANRVDLVKPGGAECFPRSLEPYLELLAETVPECQNLPKPNYVKDQKALSYARLHDNRVLWFTMAFESNIFEGKSSFDAYQDFTAWDRVIQDMLANLTSEERVGLDTVFQTCDYWQQVFMEIVGVTSAIYGLVFSLMVCAVSVVVFTGHIGIAMIAMVTILGIMLVGSGRGSISLHPRGLVRRLLHSSHRRISHIKGFSALESNRVKTPSVEDQTCREYHRRIHTQQRDHHHHCLHTTLLHHHPIILKVWQNSRHQHSGGDLLHLDCVYSSSLYVCPEQVQLEQEVAGVESINFSWVFRGNHRHLVPYAPKWSTDTWSL
ncbi:protein dispatched homolog 3-like isoform X2 [Apostichopus japonicus]|uniref:protein dispatched homolog 3-like isoform X2 n=1 Tax=Stichopus japonicus TaxID=307972 RepID=UPI003AB7CDE3